MDDLAKFINGLGAPKIFRDFIMLVAGSGFVLFLSYKYSLNLSEQIEKIIGFNSSLGVLLVFLLSAYLAGRILLIIGNALSGLIYLCFKEDKVKGWRWFWEYLRTEEIKSLSDEISAEQIRTAIHLPERQAYAEARLGNFHERYNITSMLLRMLFAATLIFSIIFHSWLWVIITIILIFLSWRADFEMKISDIVIGWILWKKEMNDEEDKKGN